MYLMGKPKFTFNGPKAWALPGFFVLPLIPSTGAAFVANESRAFTECPNAIGPHSPEDLDLHQAVTTTASKTSRGSWRGIGAHLRPGLWRAHRSNLIFYAAISASL